MAPKYPEELDVFTVPHNRMKALVQRYHETLTSTNFSSPCELMLLLQQLNTTFREFKVHESIENKYIMQKLKEKLQRLSITNKAVCNCHKDHKLTQMLRLLEDGHTKCSKSDQDRVNYGIKLRMALDDFTEQFIPHMQEEEEVLQPLLVEHFSYEELKEIKTQVIHQHTQLECFKDSPEKLYKDEHFNPVFQETEDEKVEANSVEYNLPDEVWLQVFSFLNPLELSHCAKVSKHWNQMAMDPSLWTSIHPVAWSKGFWDLDASELMVCEEETGVPNLCLGNYIEIDEDADIDESAEGVGNNCLSSSQCEIEARFLTLMVENFLVRIGHGIQKVYLTYSRVVTDDLLHKLLLLCPNIEHLDISQTKISDKAFKSLGKNGLGQKLRHLSFAGCINITDKTLRKISEAVAGPILNKSPLILQLDSPLELESCSCAHLRVNHNLHRKYTLLPSLNCKGTLLSSCCIGCPFISGPQCPLNTNACSKLQSKDNFKKFSRTSYLSTKVDEDLSSGCDIMSGCYSSRSDWTLMRDKSLLPSDKEEKNHRDSLSNYRHRNKGLEYLNLSGCYRITDEGLRALSRFGGLPHLTYLDLSGCLNISGHGIRQLVESCPKLEHEFLFYCDNIADDPYECTASGCQNLQCTTRVCCRSGE